MARAHTVWVIQDKWNSVQAAFTVKWEAQEYVIRWRGTAEEAEWKILGLGDGKPEKYDTYTIREFLNEEPS